MSKIKVALIMGLLALVVFLPALGSPASANRPRRTPTRTVYVCPTPDLRCFGSYCPTPTPYACPAGD